MGLEEHDEDLLKLQLENTKLKHRLAVLQNVSTTEIGYTVNCVIIEEEQHLPGVWGRTVDLNLFKLKAKQKQCY